MYIKSIELHNFRCFEDLKVDFHPQCNVLVGRNGAGKSSVLDGLSIALGSYLNAIDGAVGNSIHQDDVHYRMYLNGSGVNREQQFPSVITAEAYDSGNDKNTDLWWERRLNSSKGRTTVKTAKEISNYAKSMQERVRKGDAKVILPVIAYYGTGRLWAKKQERQKFRDKSPESRLKGYQDCLLPTANERMMLDWFTKMTMLRLQEEREIPELFVVEGAMADCYREVFPEAKRVSIRYSVKYGELEIQTISENDEVEYLPLHLLSDGIRTILNLVADIAYRMAVLNPGLLKEVLQKTSGVVLIDEIDMHLHPAWQKHILKDLCRVFPKVQFIVTTHAPSVLVNVPNDQIRVIDKHDVYTPMRKTYGRNIQAVMEELMGAKVRPEDILENIAGIDDAIDAGKLDEAENLLNKLRIRLGDDDQDVISAQIALNLEKM